MIEQVTLQELRDAFLECRAVKHAWERHPNPEYNLELFRTSAGVMALRCTRCLAERYDYINKAMELDTRTYKYPHGYTTIPGYKLPAVRAELFKRSLLVESYRRRNGR
jgi:hypothetical protein